MSVGLGRIPNVALLRAQAAATTITTTTIASKLPEMDAEIQEAFRLAYASAMDRHRSKFGFSTATTAVETATHTASSVVTPGQTETASPFVQFFWAWMFYSLVVFCCWLVWELAPWAELFSFLGEHAEATAEAIVPKIFSVLAWLICLPFLLLSKLIRVARRYNLATRAKIAVRDAAIRTEQVIDQKIDTIHQQLRLDTVQWYVQTTTSWIGRYKFRLVFFLAAIHLVSTMVASQTTKNEVFMEWSELQHHIDFPIPEYVFRQRKEDGSNSHYRREATRWSEIDNEHSAEAHWPAEAIPATTTTITLLQEGTGSPIGLSAEEEMRRLRVEDAGFCEHCRQKHCCEICH